MSSAYLDVLVKQNLFIPADDAHPAWRLPTHLVHNARAIRQDFVLEGVGVEVGGGGAGHVLTLACL